MTSAALRRRHPSPTNLGTPDVIALAHGHLVEGSRWLDGALSRDGSFSPVGRAARPKALNGAGVLAYLQGHEERAVALYSASLALARELEDKPGIAGAQCNLGMVMHYKRFMEVADLSRCC